MKLVYVLVVGSSLFPNTAFDYMTYQQWKKVQEESKLPQDLQQYLDEFFKQDKYQPIKNIFTAVKPYRDYLVEVVQPNTYFPNVFDAKIHCWKKQQDTTPKAPDFEDIKKRFKAVGLHNMSKNNVIFLLPDPKFPYLVIGSLSDFGSFPRIVGRYVTLVALQTETKKGNFAHIIFPKTYLYHIPGQPYDPDDTNWLVIQEYVPGIKNEQLRLHTLWLQGLHDAFYEVISKSQRQEMEIIDQKTKNMPFEELQPFQARARGIMDWELHRISEKDARQLIATLQELKRFLKSMKGYFTDHLVFRAGELVKQTNMMITKKEGDYFFYPIDLELPLYFEAQVNEQVSKMFDGSLEKPVAYHESQKKKGVSIVSDLQFLIFPTPVEKHSVSLELLPDLFRKEFSVSKKRKKISLDEQVEWLEKQMAFLKKQYVGAVIPDNNITFKQLE